MNQHYVSVWFTDVPERKEDVLVCDNYPGISTLERAANYFVKDAIEQHPGDWDLSSSFYVTCKLDRMEIPFKVTAKQNITCKAEVMSYRGIRIP